MAGFGAFTAGVPASVRRALLELHRLIRALHTTFTAERIRLSATDDASLSSTDHAFQIGPDDGSNLIIDGNEILSRSNGAAGDLFLNFEGGAVSLSGQSMSASTSTTPSVSNASGFTVSNPSCLRVTPNLCYVQFTITNGGSALGPGDISNTAVGTVTSGDCLGTLNRNEPILSTSAGSAVGWLNPSTGTIAVGWMAGTWSNGASITLGGLVVMN